MEQLAEEEQDRQKRIKEDAVANSIIMKLQSTQATLLIFSMKERIKMEDCDLGTALATPELVREKLKDHVKDPDMYNDGHWIFQSSGGKWWVGYKLDDVPKADRQKLVQRASFSNLYKTVNEDDGAYDGGDVVFMPI